MKRRWIRRIVLAMLLGIPLFGVSQVDIKIVIDNQYDSVFYFYKYKGANIFVLDTLRKVNGIIRLKQKSKLPEGIYLLTNEKNIPMTEVLVGKKQKFTLTINDLDDLNSAKVKGAEETRIYFQLMAKVRQYDMNIAALENEKEYFPDNVRKIDSLKNDLDAFKESLKINKKDTFINLVINSLKRHTLEDYWDDFQLNDARILTYPLIDNKLETYFDALPADAETINNEIDKLIAKAGDCVDVRDYLIWYFYRKYYSPKYMNLDGIFIHLVDDYFMKLEMKNVSKSMKNLMADRSKHLKHLILGAKLPQIGNLYSIDAEYVTVIFYDKTCQKCAQEGRILEEIRSRHPEMIIFPVEINSTSVNNLLLIYDIQTTPMIYVLDRQKHIIAKRIKAQQVEQFLNID